MRAAFPHRLPLALLALALLLLPAGCDGSSPAGSGGSGDPATLPDRHALAIPEPREVTTRDGALVAAWQPVGGEVPVNEPFEVDLHLRRSGPEGEAVTGASVSMTCFMPAHGHGMLREPRTEALGGGVYRIRGFLLHMEGDWSISISAVIDGLASTADDAITL